MRSLWLAAAFLTLGATSNAQSTTSPWGFDSKEGNTVFLHWGDTAAGRQLRGYDATHLGRPKVIRSLAFRRDGTSTTAGASRQLDVVLTVAETGMTIVDSRLTLGLPGGKVVFNKKKVSFPDWNKPTAKPPAKFDFVLPFNAPFVYRGRQPLAWDVNYTNPTVRPLARMDRDYTAPKRGVASIVGRGCSGFVHYLLLENNGSNAKLFGMRLSLEGRGGPANASAWLFLDFKDSKLTIPGFCTQLHALPTLQLPMTTTARGLIEHRYVSLPYIRAAEGVTFVTQLLAVDTAQRPVPLRISNACRAKMPANSSTISHDAAYAFSPNGHQARFRPHYWGGIPITQIK